MKKQLLLFLTLLFLFPGIVHSQALIALLFGKKLNTDRLELGIFMAAQGSYITGANSWTPHVGFALGAYTDIKLNWSGGDKWSLANYLVFKSPKGGARLPLSETLLSDLRPELEGSNIKRNITYVEITPLFRYTFSPSWSIAAGPMMSIRARATDTYHLKWEDDQNKNDGNFNYQYKVTSLTTPVDAGVAIDVQFRLRQGKGLRFNLRYAQGFVNVYKSETGLRGLNSDFHIGLGIPIGAHPKTTAPAKNVATDCK